MECFSSFLSMARCCLRTEAPKSDSLEPCALGLAGSLTAHLGNLTFLRSIDFGNNSFHGEIPSEIGRLIRLRHLVLRNNSFGGRIPTNLSHCLHLVTMDLRGNKLGGGIPTELGFLPRLEYLNLPFNVLTGIIPASLGNLSTLTGLVLEGCNLEGVIPHQLGQLSRLEILFLGENQLHGEVPHSVYNLSNIQRFIIHLNNLTGTLPPDIGGTSFSNFEIFSVGGNQMTGSVPRSLFNASRLAVLYLGRNFFVGSIPVEIGNLRNLTVFNVEKNYLGGEGRGYDLQFLASLTNCSALTELGAGYNNLQGMLPDSIANLSARLIKVALGGNRIYGSIRSGLGNLVNLQTLGLERNLLTGQIPSSIGNLHMLQTLVLDENNLTGQLPSFFSNLTQLVVLDLSTNLLRGPMPSGLLNSANLNYISLSNNNLSGTIPLGLAACRNLQHLDLAGNSFTGNIPGDLFVLSSLRELYLSQNLLIGLLSQEIGKLINIVEVAIDGNELSGTIPELIGNCISLELLYLDNNAFEGTIPPSFAALKVIQQVGLSHNRLGGQIPSDFTKLVYLEYLDLSYNDLRGEVPHEGVFKNVSEFSLQGNTKLCGGILELHLPSCSIKDDTKHGVHKKSASVILVVVLAVSGGVVFSVVLCAIAGFCRRRMRKKALLSSTSNGMQLRLVSYRDLEIATNGFSSETLIGTGSFGSVYKGYLNQMTIAVKVLNLDVDGASKSFMAECEALRNLRHRNLVKILTCCSGYDLKGMEFKALVFEFMENGTLESWLHPQGGVSSDHPRFLNLERRLDIAVDVANALHYLHNHSQSLIIHCDLKTGNILLDEDMVAHVSDFGLAKTLLFGMNDASWQQSSASKLKGTIGYIPPEYGMGGEVTTRGDVFSYGIILLEMVTGKRPSDSMFTEGATIFTYAKMAFQKQEIDQIVDPRLLQQLGEGGIEIVRDCMLSIVQIAVQCSSEPPNDRMEMGMVKTELELVKGKLATTDSRFHVEQS